MKFLLKVEQFLLLALQHPGDRYSRPATYHFGDVVGGDSTFGASAWRRLQFLLQTV